jgi:hypothetical protein
LPKAVCPLCLGLFSHWFEPACHGLNRFSRTAEIREVVMTDATMSEALIQYKREHGHVAMRKLLQDVAGVNAISEVATADIAAVTEAAVAGCTTKPAAKASAGPKPDFHSQAFVDHCHARFGGGRTAND